MKSNSNSPEVAVATNESKNVVNVETGITVSGSKAEVGGMEKSASGGSSKLSFDSTVKTGAEFSEPRLASRSGVQFGGVTILPEIMSPSSTQDAGSAFSRFLAAPLVPTSVTGKLAIFYAMSNEDVRRDLSMADKQFDMYLGISSAVESYLSTYSEMGLGLFQTSVSMDRGSVKTAGCLPLLDPASLLLMCTRLGLSRDEALNEFMSNALRAIAIAILYKDERYMNAGAIRGGSVQAVTMPLNDWREAIVQAFISLTSGDLKLVVTEELARSLGLYFGDRGQTEPVSEDIVSPVSVLPLNFDCGASLNAFMDYLRQKLGYNPMEVGIETSGYKSNEDAIRCLIADPFISLIVESTLYVSGDRFTSIAAPYEILKLIAESKQSAVFSVGDKLHHVSNEGRVDGLKDANYWIRLVSSQKSIYKRTAGDDSNTPALWASKIYSEGASEMLRALVRDQIVPQVQNMVKMNKLRLDVNTFLASFETRIPASFNEVAGSVTLIRDLFDMLTNVTDEKAASASMADFLDNLSARDPLASGIYHLSKLGKRYEDKTAVRTVQLMMNDSYQDVFQSEMLSCLFQVSPAQRVDKLSRVASVFGARQLNVMIKNAVKGELSLISGLQGFAIDMSYFDDAFNDAVGMQESDYKSSSKDSTAKALYNVLLGSALSSSLIRDHVRMGGYTGTSNAWNLSNTTKDRLNAILPALESSFNLISGVRVLAGSLSAVLRLAVARELLSCLRNIPGAMWSSISLSETQEEYREKLIPVLAAIDSAISSLGLPEQLTDKLVAPCSNDVFYIPTYITDLCYSDDKLDATALLQILAACANKSFRVRIQQTATRIDKTLSSRDRDSYADVVNVFDLHPRVWKPVYSDLLSLVELHETDLKAVVPTSDSTAKAFQRFVSNYGFHRHGKSSISISLPVKALITNDRSGICNDNDYQGIFGTGSGSSKIVPAILDGVAQRLNIASKSFVHSDAYSAMRIKETMRRDGVVPLALLRFCGSAEDYAAYGIVPTMVETLLGTTYDDINGLLAYAGLSSDDVVTVDTALRIKQVCDIHKGRLYPFVFRENELLQSSGSVRLGDVLRLSPAFVDGKTRHAGMQFFMISEDEVSFLLGDTLLMEDAGYNDLLYYNNVSGISDEATNNVTFDFEWTANMPIRRMSTRVCQLMVEEFCDQIAKAVYPMVDAKQSEQIKIAYKFD